MAKKRIELCGAPTEHGSPCQMPAGLGVEDSDGLGPCYMHRKAIIEVGGERHETTHEHAMSVRSKVTAKPVKLQPGRLATLLEELGAVLVVEKRKGPARVDLSFELAAARALFVYCLEQFELRNAAFVAWGKAYEAGDTTKAPPVAGTVSEAYRGLQQIVQIAGAMHTLAQSIPKRDFLEICERIGNIINIHVDDRAVRKEIQRDFQDAIRKWVVS